jgi:hypothetical protein
MSCVGRDDRGDGCTFIMNSNHAAHQVIYFLQNGKFEEQTEDSA